MVLVFTVWLELDSALLAEQGLLQLLTKPLVVIASRVKSVEWLQKSVLTVKSASSTIKRSKMPAQAALNTKELIQQREKPLVNVMMDLLARLILLVKFPAFVNRDLHSKTDFAFLVKRAFTKKQSAMIPATPAKS